MDKHTIMHFHPPTDEDLDSSLYISWAGKKKWGAGESIGFKTVYMHVLVYVNAGAGTVIQGNGEAVALEAGSAFLIFPGTRFQFTASDAAPWELYWVAFGGERCEKILSDIHLSVEHYYVRGLAQNAAHIMETLSGHMDVEENDHLAVRGCLLLLFSEISRRQGKRDRKGVAHKNIVSMAVRYIECYYFMHIDVDMLCDYVKYSRSYLSRLFNNELGVTIPEYINQVRVRHAKELFERTTLSVQEVSASVGITDSFYFSKTFKKLVGVSPNQYKKQNGVYARQSVAK